MSARLLVPPGNPLHLKEGDASSPSQVYRVGIGPPAVNAELLSSSFTVDSSLVTTTLEQASSADTSASISSNNGTTAVFGRMGRPPSSRVGYEEYYRCRSITREAECT